MPTEHLYAVTERSVGLFTLHTTSFRRGNNSQRNAAPLAALAGTLPKGVLDVPRRRPRCVVFATDWRNGSASS